jgi:cytochrome c biogenesis protein CcdA/thiol-disulfide isomerase/thioredoxin
MVDWSVLEASVVTLILVAFAAGLIAGISPCILPVLPIVFVAGVAAPDATETPKGSWRRSVAIVLGLVLSFSLLVLVGSEILSGLHLPQNTLMWVGVVLLGLVGLGFVIPVIGEWLERPFARMVGRQPSSSSGGFVIGLALGLVFVPCAGPVLAAITVLGATRDIHFETVLVTLAFAVGAVVPLLFIALAGGGLVHRVQSVRQRAPLYRQIGGVVLLVMAIGIATNSFDFLQRDVPGYTSVLQKKIEGSTSIRKQLNALKGTKGSQGVSGSLVSCPSSSPGLVTCGLAPNFTDVTTWLNSPGDQPLTIKDLRGKVVIVDFWTYSCINCQRSLPHVEAWYKRYAPYGLEIVGVHTPEFAFEHVVSNVKAQANVLGVKYPIAVDNSYGTWNAYDNEYWPAEYLIDARGVVRHVDFGEGNYALTETLIRRLLVAAHPGLKLPPPTSVANLTPFVETSPESYIGYKYGLTYLDSNVAPAENVATRYRFPKDLSSTTWALSGVWNEHAEEATSVKDSKLEINYLAQDVFLVMGGTGTVTVSLGNGTAPTTIHVNGVPRLYTLFHAKFSSSGNMVLKFTPGVQAFDFTFG